MDHLSLFADSQPFEQLMDTYDTRRSIIASKRKQSHGPAIDKVYFSRMVATFRDLQRKALQGLSKYSIELSGIYQKELHQNMDVLNFANSRMFTKEGVKLGEMQVTESDVIGDTVVSN